MSREGSRVYVLDTGVLVEYIDKSSPLARRVELTFEKALKGELMLHTTSLVLAETIYVSSRLYELTGVERPNEEALNYVTWLREHIELKVRELDEALALKMGELKKKLKLALTDCSVIACALEVKGVALFRKIEREMVPILGDLRDLGVEFLEEKLAEDNLGNY